MNLAHLGIGEILPPPNSEESIRILSHAIGLGIVLMMVSAAGIFFTTPRKVPAGPSDTALESDATNASTPQLPTAGEMVLNAANVLYLCIGMAGMMLLVSNNIARAFAIGAAIALIRFRIKVDSKSFGMCLFYGVLVGMACGVNQITVAYATTAVFTALQVIVLSLSRLADRLCPHETVAAEMLSPPRAIAEGSYGHHPAAPRQP